uniref:Uncharacterized protein n=1 Tax=Rhizophora mucronata TaxID=61149 RepID=A0A2P2Q5H1_RHIMU
MHFNHSKQEKGVKETRELV